MEAIAIYSYESKNSNVLEFFAGDVLKIIPLNKDWCRAKLNGKEGFAPLIYLEVKPHPWFKGSVSEEQLHGYLLQKDANGNFAQPDGVFCIRYSYKILGDFFLSVKIDNQIRNFKIKNESDKFFLWYGQNFISFNKLVEYYMENSIRYSKELTLKNYVENLYEAKCDYEANDSHEISFKCGDIIKIINDTDNYWWMGVLNNSIGIIPAKHLKPLISNN